jgi:hypothetical protein
MENIPPESVPRPYPYRGPMNPLSPWTNTWSQPGETVRQ